MPLSPLAPGQLQARSQARPDRRKVPARLLTSQLCNAGERIAKLCGLAMFLDVSFWGAGGHTKQRLCEKVI